MTRLITNEELKTAVRQALDSGNLLALAPGYDGDGHYELKFNDQVYHCAIGVSLNRYELDLILNRRLNSGDVASVQGAGIIHFEDLRFARVLQGKHDRVFRAPPNTQLRQELIDEFKQLVI